MSSLLNSPAIGAKDGEEAMQLLQALVTTPGFTMAHTAKPKVAPAATAAPASPGAPDPMTGRARPGGRAQGGVFHADDSTLVAEHEIFKNNKNALAFFFYHQQSLDGNPQEGPFWFRIDNNRIIAGTEEHFAVLDDVTPPLIEAARQRGVIMLVEFEEQQPVRCTPCYLSDNFGY
jgi:hypothetical protein